MTVMNSPLQEAFDFYLAHQDAMVEQHDGKVVVIAGGAVVGVYDGELEAVNETQKTHPIGTFLVQRVSEGDVEYSQTFRSRAVFQ